VSSGKVVGVEPIPFLLISALDIVICVASKLHSRRQSLANVESYDSFFYQALIFHGHGEGRAIVLAVRSHPQDPICHIPRESILAGNAKEFEV